MSLALHYWMSDAHHCSGPPVSEMTYTVSSGTLNSTIPYWILKLPLQLPLTNLPVNTSIYHSLHRMLRISDTCVHKSTCGILVVARTLVNKSAQNWNAENFLKVKTVKLKRSEIEVFYSNLWKNRSVKQSRPNKCVVVRPRIKRAKELKSTGVFAFAGNSLVSVAAESARQRRRYRG